LTGTLRTQEHVTKAQLDLIVEWKHAGQGDRVGVIQDRYSNVPESRIRKITNAAFGATDPALQLKILTAIPGVGYATATVILAFHDPDANAVGDRIGNETVLGERTAVTPTTYLALLKRLRAVRPDGQQLRDVVRVFYVRNHE